MNFDEYQEQSRKTATYPHKDDNYIYPTLGLGGEAGEVCEKIKKIIRDKGGHIGTEDREQLKRELGDVLWYVSNLACELNLSLSSIARTNLKKLFDRMERGKLQGSGDNR